MATPNLNNKSNVTISNIRFGTAIPTGINNDANLITDGNDSTGLKLTVDGFIQFTPQEDCKLWVKTGKIWQAMELYDHQDNSLFGTTSGVAQSILTQGGSNYYELFPGHILKANKPYTLWNNGPVVVNGDIEIYEMFFERTSHSSNNQGNTPSNGGGGNTSNPLLNSLQEITLVPPYRKTTWTDGTTIIDAQKMNNIENAIQKNTSKINEIITATNLIRDILLSLNVSPTDLTALTNEIASLKTHVHSNTVGYIK